MFSVTILGNNSAVPAYDRLPSSQLVDMDGQLFLIDCGEGTQMQLMRYKIRYGRIAHIFISHLHGDHYFGLIGLINSFGLLNRQEDLHIYGPAPLKGILDLQLQVASTQLPFTLHFHEITKAGILTETESLTIRCFPTDHRIACFGFSFSEKRIARKLAAAGREPRRYAYCADTRYQEELIDHIREFDLIYHEATYLDKQKDKAIARYHSTAKQAAELAKKARVRKLLLGHFSSQYESIAPFEEEARSIFPDTENAMQGVTYFI